MYKLLSCYNCFIFKSGSLPGQIFLVTDAVISLETNHQCTVAHVCGYVHPTGLQGVPQQTGAVKVKTSLLTPGKQQQNHYK